MIVSIHQPNFFPWLGYFRKIQRSDTFVFMDDVQFPRTSRGTWTNRVKLLVAGQARWTTCPIERAHELQLICDVRIDKSQPWRKRLLATLQANYARTAYFATTMQWLEPLVLRQLDRLSEYNIDAVTDISRRLGISRKFVIASQHPDRAAWAELTGSGRLAAMCRALGAGTYLAGDGSLGYEDETIYVEQGISLIYNNFICPPYPQTGQEGIFSSGLSVLDAIFNVGLEETSALLFA
jgi:hypothetical protein